MRKNALKKKHGLGLSLRDSYIFDPIDHQDYDVVLDSSEAIGHKNQEKKEDNNRLSIMEDEDESDQEINLD